MAFKMFYLNQLPFQREEAARLAVYPGRADMLRPPSDDQFVPTCDKAVSFPAVANIPANGRD